MECLAGDNSEYDTENNIPLIHGSYQEDNRLKKLKPTSQCLLVREVNRMKYKFSATVSVA